MRSTFIVVLLFMIGMLANAQASFLRIPDSCQCLRYTINGLLSSVIPTKTNSSIGSFYEMKALAISDSSAMLLKLNDESSTSITRKLSVKGSDFSLFKLSGGWVSYNFNYRGSLDSPFTETNIIQNTVNVNLRAVIGRGIPVSVSYIERNTNSDVFQDFRDFTITIDQGIWQNLKEKRYQDVSKNVLNSFVDPSLNKLLSLGRERLSSLYSITNNQAIIQQYIESKEQLYLNRIDSSGKGTDTSLLKAKCFINWYESKQSELNIHSKWVDSVRNMVDSGYFKARRTQKMLQTFSGVYPHVIPTKRQLARMGLPKFLKKRFSGSISGLQSLSVGRVIPSQSRLSVSDLNVRGVNVEYNQGRFFSSATAGVLDFRLRDFVKDTIKRTPQYVLSAKVGYGNKYGNNIYTTYFFGRRYSIGTQSQVAEIAGASIGGQWIIDPRLKLNAEFAHSTPVVRSSLASNRKEQFDISDQTSHAYFIEMKSDFSKVDLHFSGSYQHTGYNFQNFTYYRYNSNADAYAVKIDKYFLKRQIRISTAIKRNEFSNPLVANAYNANTVFKTFSVSINKKKWPAVNLGYLPVSQLVVIDNRIFETRYQSLNGSIAYSNRIMTGKMTTLFTYNRFFNSGSDSALVYNNSQNIYFKQSLLFERNSMTYGFSSIRNSSFSLDVMEAGITRRISSYGSIGFGAKITRFNMLFVGTGYFIRSDLKFRAVGDFNLSYESSYLPGVQKALLKNEMGNVTFTRYF